MTQNSAYASRRDLLSVAEVAMELGCSAPTVRRRINSGELPAVQLGGPGTGLRVSSDELEAWLTQDRPSYLDRDAGR